MLEKVIIVAIGIILVATVLKFLTGLVRDILVVAVVVLVLGFLTGFFPDNLPESLKEPMSQIEFEMPENFHIPTLDEIREWIESEN